MATTPNLLLRELLTTDVYDEAAVNITLRQLDRAVGRALALVATADADFVLPGGESSLVSLEDPQALLTAGRALRLPAGRGGGWTVENRTAVTLDVGVVGGGADFTLAAGVTARVRSDGTTVRLVTDDTLGGGAAGGSGIRDVGFFFAGVPSAGGYLTHLVENRSLALPANLTGSYATAAVAATAATIFSLRGAGGVTLASITFGIGATTGTFGGPGGRLFSGDTLSIHAPNPMDATLANIGVMLAGAP